MKITEQVKDLMLSKYCTDIEWRYHLESVYKFACELSEKIKCDKEIVELATLLHDIGRYVTGEQENHEKSGLPEARKVLENLKYGPERTEHVLDCIASHRGSKDVEVKTVEAEIVKNADAMAHYDILPLFFIGIEETDDDIQKRAQSTKEKFERNWNKKLTLMEAKDAIREKHKAIMLILDSVLAL